MARTRKPTEKQAQASLVEITGIIKKIDDQELAMGPLFERMDLDNSDWRRDPYIPDEGSGILQRDAAHVESTDPVTKEKIRFTVTPDGIHDLEPAGAVMSYVKPEDTVIDENVINGFCHYILFFTSKKSGKEWVLKHENTALMSMDDAFKLAKSKNETQYSEILSTT